MSAESRNMTQVYTKNSSAVRAMRKKYPNGGCTVEPCDGGFYIQTGEGYAPKQKTEKPVPAEQDIKPVDMDVQEVLNRAYRLFNETLFDSRLPDIMLVIHRKRGARGYFWADQWQHREDSKNKRHEIAMNPDTFKGRTTKDILSTLVHEMVHLEQEVYGKPSNGGYHNKEWAIMMRRVGLLPYAADTTTPVFTDDYRIDESPLPEVVKDTGTRVTHVIIPGGPFCYACDGFLGLGYKIVWQAQARSAGAERRAKVKRASKTKFSCPECDLNTWAKPDASIGCWDCGVEMEDAG